MTKSTNRFRQRQIDVKEYRKMLKKNKVKSAGKSHVKAKSIEAFGKIFPSQIEHDFYAWLLSEKIDFTYQPKFEFKVGVGKDKKINLLENDGIRAVTYTIDFGIKLDKHRVVYVELKGFHKKKVVRNGVMKKGVLTDNVASWTRNKSYAAYMQKVNFLRHYLYEKKRFGDRVLVVDSRLMGEFRKQLLEVISGKLDMIELKY